MTDSDKYMQNGYACMSQNNFAQAIEYFQAVLQFDPKNEEAKMCLYLALTKQGKPQYAEQYRKNVELSDTMPPLEASYVKWHKEQVIEKWSKVFNGPGITKDDHEMISCQMFLFPESGTDNKHRYDLLITPLNYINVKCSLPIIGSISPVEIKKEIQKGIFPGPRTYFEVKTAESNGFGTCNYIPMQGPINTVGANALEETEYEYYRLWAYHYLGLWQWEKWHPFANIRDTVGKKFEIMGIDDEMSRIANLSHDSMSVRVPSDKISILNEHFCEPNQAESFYQDLRRGYLSDFTLTQDYIDILNADDLDLKKTKGYYGEYFVDSLSFCCDDKTCSTVLFGSSGGQVLKPGDIIRYIWDGVGVIIEYCY